MSLRGVSVNQINSGESLLGLATNSAKTLNGAKTAVYTYNLNLISVLGSLCNSSYFPLFACTGAPLRLEIQLVDNLQKAMGCTAGGTITITNMEYVANFIELSDVAMSMITQSLEGQPLQFVIPSFRNYALTSPSGHCGSRTNFTTIPAKFSSLKSIFITSRDNRHRSTYLFSHLVLFLLVFLIILLGLVLMFFHRKAPNRLTEMFCEVCKAIGSIADLNHQPSIEKTSYCSTNSTAITNEALLILSIQAHFILV